MWFGHPIETFSTGPRPFNNDVLIAGTEDKYVLFGPGVGIRGKDDTEV